MQLLFKRIIFEGPKRADFITLINESNKPKTYRIVWREMTMDPQTGLRKKTDSEIAQTQYKVSDMVKYSPRRITVQPRQTQEIRLMLRRPNGLPDGEYRSHLLIREERQTKNTVNNSGGNASNVDIRTLPGISLPVFCSSR